MGRAGIFVLRNTSTGEQYVGQSKDIDNQSKKQDSLMRNGRHYNSYIQQDYNRGHRFSFSILEYCSQSQLNQRKNYWIRKLNTFNEGYNQTGRNRSSSNIRSRSNYSTYSSPTYITQQNSKKQQTPNYIKLINQIKNYDHNKQYKSHEHNNSEREMLQKKLESALDKYNRRFNRLRRLLKLRYLIILLIIIFIFPAFVANLLLIIFVIIWLGIFLAKMEYNSYVNELKEYGITYERLDHTTIKVLNTLRGVDLINDFGKIWRR